MNSGFLEHMRVFAAVARAGSLTGASIATGIAQPTISRQLTALEKHLGCLLVRRSTRTLGLTEQGETFLQHALKTLEASEEAQSALRSPASRLAGRLRVACSHGFGKRILIPALPVWQRRHPDVDLELVLSDGIDPVVEKNLDLAIRIAPMRGSNLVAKRIGLSQQVAVASRSYVNRHGTVTSPEQLGAHQCLVYTGAAKAGAWTFKGPAGSVTVRVGSRLKLSSVDALRDAVLAGLGVALTPSWFWKDAAPDQVVRLLEGLEGPRSPVYAVTSSRRDRDGKTAAFIDFASRAFAASGA